MSEYRRVGNVFKLHAKPQLEILEELSDEFLGRESGLTKAELDLVETHVKYVAKVFGLCDAKRDIDVLRRLDIYLTKLIRCLEVSLKVLQERE